MKKHLKSLRDYIGVLDGLGDLQEIGDEVSTDLELGAVIRYGTENRLPAPLFSRIRGHRPGFRVLGAPGALSSLPGARWARVAVSLGLAPGVHPLEIVGELALAREAKPLPPVITDTAACQQNVLRGADAVLDTFPVPLIHAGDGGRYIGTWGALVARTPDGSWTNWSITRVMMAGSQSMAVLIKPPQDIGKIYAMWRERGEPMPAALVQGCEPAVPFVCSMGLPSGCDEAAYLGGYFGEPIEVTRCATVDLEVPASAEIVIEGHISLTQTAPEGPMGEFFGYVSGSPRPYPLFQVSAITHRDEPILPVVSAGKPVEEVHTAVGVTYSAEALYRLRKAGMPVSAAWLLPEGASNVLAVTVPRTWREHFYGACTTTRMLTRAIAHVALQNKLGFWITRVMVFDDDIDLADLRDLWWGFATRCHPAQGQLLVEDQIFTPLHIFYTPGEMRTLSGPKMAYDCLLPPEPERRPQSTGFRVNFPAPVRDRAVDIWERHGQRPGAARAGAARSSGGHLP